MRQHIKDFLFGLPVTATIVLWIIAAVVAPTLAFVLFFGGFFVLATYTVGSAVRASFESRKARKWMYN